ncbi:MAG: PQQ-dependent sugar dehydrogenase [Adhaeribacter sp.]
MKKNFQSARLSLLQGLSVVSKAPARLRTWLRFLPAPNPRRRPRQVVAGCLLAAAGLLSGCEHLEDFFDHKNRHFAMDLELVADGFTSPLGVVAAPGERGNLFVIDQIGKIWLLDASGHRAATPFLDVSASLIPLNPNGDERGLLGLAFHPDYAQNGRFFIYYQLPPRPGGPAPQPGPNWNNLSRISEFKVSPSDPHQADPGSEKVVLQWDDPQGNHNGGTIAFGPDGYLYIAIGDGGAANDVAPGHVEDWYAVNAGGNGQDIEANLFGSILRLDVDHGSPYAIPADNPFVNKPGLDEIYAYGFRNPYRFSFDMGGAHQLFAGDAGQALYEEVSIVRKGGNYGWNVKEGRSCFNAASNLQELPDCPSVDNFGNPLIDPIIEVIHFRNPKGGKATTVIGGNVYRGRALSQLQGKYLYGTFSQAPGVANAELFLAVPAGGGSWASREVTLKSFPDDLGHYLKGFGQDPKGEIYLALTGVAGPTGTAGKIYKLVPVKKNSWN